ncbi:AAA family ATPase [Pseudonocardia sp. RS010]|uniref:AAA family ATPase n=1 Tax=Pseudonocardia sp. RS010 TaxID=3385979 RepID=UPI0039A30F33
MGGRGEQVKLDPTEKVIVDVLRVGLAADSAGLRQLCRRLIRTPPRDSSHPESLRAELQAVLTAAPTPASAGLRWAASPTNATKTEAPSPRRRRLTDEVTTPPSGLLWTSSPALHQPILNARTTEAVNQFIAEQTAHSSLEAAGLSPSRSALLIGPPGVGKTLSASYIAARLDLELKTVDLAAMMSSYLGRTGQNLATALEEAGRDRCVLLLDEFDALAKRRSDEADVGELKRLVNVLLQQLDHKHSSNSSILLAATNHPELLDRAVMRRFDTIIEFDLPSALERLALIKALPTVQFAGLSEGAVEALAVATEGESHSTCESLIKAVARKSIISTGSTAGLEDRLVAWSSTRLREAAALDHKTRDRLVWIFVRQLGYSLRRTGELLGITHPTVSKSLAAFEALLDKSEPKAATTD